MYILLALQLVANPGHYIWTQIASFQTSDACHSTILKMVETKGRLEKRENYICVPSGSYEMGPAPMK